MYVRCLPQITVPFALILPWAQALFPCWKNHRDSITCQPIVNDICWIGIIDNQHIINLYIGCWWCVKHTAHAVHAELPWNHIYAYISIRLLRINVVNHAVHWVIAGIARERHCIGLWKRFEQKNIVALIEKKQRNIYIYERQDAPSHRLGAWRDMEIDRQFNQSDVRVCRSCVLMFSDRGCVWTRAKAMLVCEMGRRPFNDQ